MEEKRKPYFKEGEELMMPAALFLYVLKELKKKNSFDCIEVRKFDKCLRSIFGDKYIDNNWGVAKEALLSLKEIKLFSGLVEKDELYWFISITEEGLFSVENGVPGEWCKNKIETVIKNLRIKD